MANTFEIQPWVKELVFYVKVLLGSDLAVKRNL